MGSRCFVPLEGGEIEIINVPAPGGGGVEWFYTVPARYEMSLLTLSFELVTSGVAGARYLGLFFGYMVGAIYERVFIQTPTLVLDSSNQKYFFSLGSPDVNTTGLLSVYNALPDLRWPSGAQWGTVTFNLKPGDLFQNINQVVSKWEV